MTKFLKGECAECRGHIEFPAEAAGTTAECPHCGKTTELMLAAPPQESAISKKTIVYLVIALVILVGGLGGTMFALKRAKNIAAEKGKGATSRDAPKAPNPFASQGFEASPVKVEKAANSALVYATGSVRNLENRQRFGVRIELELLNEGGSKIGTARDYQAVIETNGVSHYRASVLEKKAVSGRVVAIEETQ